MKYKPIIIGLAGTKSAGKDTAASMINYILANGIAQADYYTWYDKYKDIDTFPKVIHFADKLKQLCSELFKIPLHNFNDKDCKDNLYYCISTRSFISEDYKEAHKYKEITIDFLIEHGLPKARTIINSIGYISCIKLRTIMQYIGTNVFRNLINPNIWVDITMERAIEISDKGYCIIADVRFKNEVEAFYYIRDRPCKTILITRKTKYGKEHESEVIDFKTDYVIENNDSYMVLFYKLVNLLKELV